MWFKVDDKLHDHRKTRKAGKAAMGVWVLAGSWSMDNDQDGFIPANVLTRWGSIADARRLTEAGLWRETAHKGEPGWRFHDWTRFQPSAAVTEAKRAAEREAGLRGNHKRWHVGRGVTDPDCDYCHRVPDGEPDDETIGEPESGANRPVPVPEPITTSPNGEVVKSGVRDDVEQLCTYLADAVEQNGSKRPTITQTWRVEARRMLDLDKRTVGEILRAIDWCQRGESAQARFWRPNVMSMPKLRAKFDQMRLQAAQETHAQPSRFQQHMALVRELADQQQPTYPQIGPA